MKRLRAKHVKACLLVFLFGLVISFAAALMGGILSPHSAAMTYGLLSDAFFTAGVVLTGFGLWRLILRMGTFDVLTYGAKTSLSFLGRWSDDKRKEIGSIHEYKERKAKEAKPFSHFVFVGCLYLIASFIMLNLYTAGIPAS